MEVDIFYTDAGEGNLLFATASLNLNIGIT